jgi:hypothetical protein
MAQIDYCPFCGCEDVKLVHLTNDDFECYYVKCQHCRSQGPNYSVDDKLSVEEVDDAISSAIQEWNDKDLRPDTVCHKVKRLWGQLIYDIDAIWYKIRNWDW